MAFQNDIDDLIKFVEEDVLKDSGHHDLSLEDIFLVDITLTYGDLRRLQEIVNRIGAYRGENKKTT